MGNKLMRLQEFPKYEAYKDSGVAWLGKIPAGWNLVRVKNAAEINPALKLKATEPDKEACFLPMEKIESNGLVDYGTKSKIKETRQGFTNFKQNDVIVAKITPCFENGKGAHLEKMPTEHGFGSTEFHVIRNKYDFSPKSLYYLTKTHLFMALGERLRVGSAGQKRVQSEFLETINLHHLH